MYRTLTECIEDRKYGNEGIIFIEGHNSEEFVLYSEIYNKASTILFHLQERGMNPGDELVLQLDSNKMFIQVFWACLLGGIRVVPLATGRNDDQKMKLFNVLNILDNPFIITTARYISKIEHFAAENGLQEIFGKVRAKIIQEDACMQQHEHGEIHHAGAADIAYIQFSSGSTGQPKGVMLTHRNILANISAILKGIKHPPHGDSFFSWMPLTHDMGLIGFHLTPFVAGWTHYIMPTEVFIRRPYLWLEKISEHRITFTASPNFGYRYLLNRLNEQPLPDIDLSALRIITNGAEPISAGLCKEFITRLAAYGLKNNVLFPVYGLAEACLAVTFSQPEREIESIRLDRQRLNLNARIREVAPEQGGAVFVNVGKAIEGCSIKIVNPDTLQENEEDRIGTIYIKGDNITAGYYNNPRMTASVFTGDGWLNTGDVGVFRDNCLYVIGREKEIIFINGQNYYPQDVERVMEAAGIVTAGKMMIAGFFNEELQNEEVIVAILYKGNISEFVPVAASVKRHIYEHFGFVPHIVLPVKEIPKTTSGKIQRYKLLERYRNGEFKEMALSLEALQIASQADIVVLPANGVEQKLLTIWQGVLDNKKLHVTANFFEAGGNSLKATALLARISDEYGVSLPYQLLSEKPSVREMATALEAPVKGNDRVVRYTSPGDDNGLTPAQRLLYYTWELNKKIIAYNIPVALFIEGAIEPERLVAALRKLVLRHAALRTIFKSDRGVPVKYVMPDANIEFQHMGGEKDSISDMLQKLPVPFDLHTGPLFRSALVSISSDESVLFLDFHHIIADGISICNFVAELFTAYQDGELAPLTTRHSNNGIPVPGYSSKAGEPDLFWLEQFKDGVPVLHLPFDFSRPSLLKYDGRKLVFELDSNLVHRLDALREKQQVTMAMLLLTSYFTLLSKYTGQEDLVIGVPVSGRRHPQDQQLIGMFVNSLPIRCKPEGSKSFDRFLREVQETFIKAYDHQDYSFEALIDQLSVQRDLSRNALFDTMFVFQDLALPAIKLDNHRAHRLFFDPGCSKYDLSMELFEEEGKMKLYFEYATSLFIEDTIRAMAAHFKIILEQVTANPSMLLSDIGVLEAKDDGPVTKGINTTGGKKLYNVTIHELFEKQAAGTPNAIAIYCGDASISYSVLNEKANGIAALLRKKDIKPNACIGVMLDRSAAFIIALLGILKSGGYYFPIDPEWPDERMKFLIEDARANVVITTEHIYNEHAYALSTVPRENILFIDKIDLYAKEENPEHWNSPNDLAYVLYTSGTTGNPKGVMIAHRSLVNYVLWAADTYVKGERVIFPFFTSVTFDLTVTSIFTPLISGNALVIYPDSAHAVPLVDVLLENKANVIKLTPAHLHLVKDNNIQMKHSTAIRRFIVGGENLKSSLSAEVYQQFGGKVEIYNEYGPTEATVGCMIHLYVPERDTGVAVPIGIPINNTRIYLLDKYLKRVPAGVRGEIYISGEGVGRGYLFRPELTREKFLPDPFNEGEWMYRTGDIAKRLPDRSLYFIGREDEQVKIKGYRIELGEVEAALLKHPLLKDAVVIKKTIAEQEGYLCAFYRTEGVNVTAGELKEHLGLIVPAYMIPLCFVQLEKIPVNNNGKVDYKALANIPVAVYKKTGEPRNEMEELAIRIWKDVLHIDNICIYDNFLELGGDSIKAVQIAARLLNEHLLIDSKNILIYQTIDQIMLHVERTDNIDRYEQYQVHGHKGFSPIEAWFFNENFADHNYYTQSVTIRMKREIDIVMLRPVFRKLTAHHDGLRLNYDKERNLLYFNNHLLEENSDVPYYDITGYTTKDKIHKIKEIGISTKEELDISHSSLLKPVLIRESENSWLLMLVVHHLGIDGISWRILLEDLYRLINATIKREEILLPAKTASLKDWYNSLLLFSEQQLREEEDGEAVQNNFMIPADTHCDDWKTGDANEIHFEMNETQTAYLSKDGNKTYNTDLQILLIVALVRALYSQVNTDHIILELEGHGRNLEGIDVSHTIGWFTSMYPVRFSCREFNIGDQIKYVKESIRACPDNGIAYGIRKYMKNQVKGGAGDKTGVRFNYLGFFDKEINNDLFTYAEVDTGSDISLDNHMTSAIEINCIGINQKIRFSIKYNHLAYSNETMTRLKDNLMLNIDHLAGYLRNEEDLFFTPSDFEAAELKEEDLKVLFE